jgi:hypothetical protein
MIHLTSGLGLVLEVGLAVFCFVDVLMRPEGQVRYMPRWGWALSILVFPVAACVAYLVVTHALRTAERAAAARAGTSADGEDGAAGVPAPGTATAVRADKRTAGRPVHPSQTGAAPHPEGAPDDDADLLLELSRLNDEHGAMLRRWEADLRAREERLRAAGTDLPDVGGSEVDSRDDVAA